MFNHVTAWVTCKGETTECYPRLAGEHSEAFSRADISFLWEPKQS